MQRRERLSLTRRRHDTVSGNDFQLIIAYGNRRLRAQRFFTIGKKLGLIATYICGQGYMPVNAFGRKSETRYAIGYMLAALSSFAITQSIISLLL